MALVARIKRKNNTAPASRASLDAAINPLSGSCRFSLGFVLSRAQRAASPRDTILTAAMADSVYLPGLSVQVADVPRHSSVVRVTHWINTLSFLGLLVSGIAILIAHPRLYWGETGSVGTPSLMDLPLPFVLVGQSGWGRYLHFLSAWVCVLNGLLYISSGVLTKHFRKDLLAGNPSREEPAYSILQRLAYSSVVFILFPLVVWTGLAMSPAITSVFPALVNLLGGQQSARTIHFFVAAALVLFLLIHIAMVYLAGFTSHVRAMITGRSAAGKGNA
jgi:thiosulfate reductase cytochrome b subunit